MSDLQPLCDLGASAQQLMAPWGAFREVLPSPFPPPREQILSARVTYWLTVCPSRSLQAPPGALETHEGAAVLLVLLSAASYPSSETLPSLPPRSATEYVISLQRICTHLADPH